jgi:predicted MFS family arabinose efflux permease
VTLFRMVWRDPAIRLCALGMLLLGMLNSSVYPYQSLVATRVVGLSEPAFAAVLVMASSVAVSASVLFGIWGDQRSRRRAIALGMAGAALAGVLLMLLAPGPLALVLAHGILLPVASGLYGQFFALARLARGDDATRREAVLGAVRAMMSLSFLAMLVFWTFAFGAGAGVMSVYLSAGLAAAGMVGLVWRLWPQDGQTAWEDRPSGLNFRGAMAEIGRPRILTRLVALGAIAAAGNLYMTLAALVFAETPGRGAGDAALYIGLIAGWEVPFMVLLPRLAHRMGRTTLLFWGAVIYGMHLALLPVLAGTPWVWGLTLLGGLGGTAIITLPIGYYQDLLPDRPGTAGALLSVQKLAADIFAASAFAFGMVMGGHGLAALLGAALSVAGAAVLWALDRRGVSAS